MNNRIAISPNICHGKPVIQGPRTPVTVILNALAAGNTIPRIAKDYDITEEDIKACIAFASDNIS